VGFGDDGADEAEHGGVVGEDPDDAGLRLTEVVYIRGLLSEEIGMDEREQQRKVRHRLAVLRHAEEVTGSVAATCRYYGISRPTFYKWLHRYEEHGEEGLRDRSSAPFNSPNAMPAEVVAVPSSKERSTGTSSTAASVTSTFAPQLHD
jgi:transposase-like protein